MPGLERQLSSNVSRNVFQTHLICTKAKQLSLFIIPLFYLFKYQSNVVPTIIFLIRTLYTIVVYNFSVHPTEEVTNDGVQLTIVKSQWRNIRCDEAAFIKSKFQSQLNRDQVRMVFLLCRGPKFTNYQARYLRIHLKTTQASPLIHYLCVSVN